MTPTNITHDAFGVEIPPGAGRAYYAARFTAMLRGERALEHKPENLTESRAVKRRKPTLASALKQAAKAGKSVKGAEIYQDRVTLQFGEPEPIESGNSWPLDEFRTKETKQ
jgi:hypothetical protein